MQELEKDERKRESLTPSDEVVNRKDTVTNWKHIVIMATCLLLVLFCILFCIYIQATVTDIAKIITGLILMLMPAYIGSHVRKKIDFILSENWQEAILLILAYIVPIYWGGDVWGPLILIPWIAFWVTGDFVWSFFI